MSKTLPIQMVKTRGTQDLFKKEGGNSKTLPAWVTDEAVQRNATLILSQLNSLDSVFREKETDNQENLPVLLTASLNQQATAKSYRSSTRAVFDLRGKRNIIGLENVNQLIVKIENSTDLNVIKRKLNGYNTSTMSKDKRCGIASVVDLKRFIPVIDEENLIGKTIKVKLVDYQNAKINETANKLFVENCNKNGIETQLVTYSRELKLFRIPTASREAIRQIATMDGVLSVKPMPYVEIMASPEPYNTELDVLSPQDGENYAEAGLLDSGVEAIPHLAPWIKGTEQNTAGLNDADIDRGHGTAVAGIMLYGDQLQGKDYTGCKPMRLTSCIVNTDPNKVQIEEYELVEHIRTAIENNPTIKVWNLSQGSKVEVDDNSFSDFAIALDNIQKEFNVLFCKSSGNQEHPESGHIRITHGAESIRSLVVGSISHENNGGKDGEVNHRSPFSRIGFGPEYLVKPDLVHYGGNMETGVQSFSYTGFQTSLCHGTSFSTPRVTALAAHLTSLLNRDFDPVLIKALLIHHANYPDVGDNSSESLLKELGHGVPGNINDILNNDSDEFTMVWQPEFEAGSDFQILDFPFPNSMVDEDGFFYGDITVTLVTDPILKETEGSEYCQSDITVLLETYSDTEYYVLGAAGTPSFYRNADRIKNAINVLAKDRYGAHSFRSENLCERTLIEKDHKYQPVKKYHVSLEQMKPAEKKRALEHNRHWCAKIKTLYRDATDAERKTDGIEETVKTTILITIRDTRHKGIIYDECLQLLEQRNFEHNDIVVRQHVEVRNED